MEQIVRGTTPSLVIDFSEVTEIPDFSVEDISAASLIIKRRTEKKELSLADMSLDGTALSYHFTQEQTLAFTAGEIITLDMHIVVNGEYQGYNLDELVQSVNTAVGKVNAMETDVSELKSGLSDLLISAFVTDSASGGVAHFEDGADNVPLKSLKVNIVPVQSGSGDPSPDNVRPITGWGVVKVTRAGKNLWNPSDVFTGFINNITNTIQDNSVSKICYIRAKPNTTYTISKMVGARFSVACSDVEPAINAPLYGVILDYTGTSITITTENSTKYLLAWCYLSSADTATEAEMLASVQFELGSGATEYEPYNGVNVSIDLGRTVYGGTLDVVSGELTVDMAMVDLGSLTWTYQTATGLFYSNVFPPCKANTLNLLFSNRAWTAKVSQGEVRLTDKTICKDSNGRFYAHDSSYSATADFQSAMSGSMMCYELATPITYNLTPTEVKSLLGINNVWSDAGDVTAEYRADTKLYIDKRLAEVTA